MTTPIPDLWPQSFDGPREPPPVTILRQQGLLLGQRMGNLVYGEVLSRALSPDRFAHVLEVVAPLLAYRRPVVVAFHGIEQYPAEVGRPAVKGPTDCGIPAAESPVLVNSTEEFVTALRTILQSGEVMRLLQTLYAQSAGAETTTTTLAPTTTPGPW